MANVQKTIVITGASSGIGRATAEAFATHDVHLVLAARREEALEATAAACRDKGARALVVPTDVTDPTAMENLAAKASEFGNGTIDVWINNAGVGAVGQLEDIPPEAHDRVIRTNLIGYMYGARAVIPFFKRVGRGTLVNVVSLGAWAPSPFATSYTASKYGLRGFSEALRLELVPWSNIQICDVFPSVIDTPGFRHGANYTGRMLKPPRPLYDARTVARAIVRAVSRKRSRGISVGVVAKFSKIANALVPSLVRVVSSHGVRRYLDNAPKVPITDGNLFEPSKGSMSVNGGWRGLQRGRKLQTGLLAGTLLIAGLVLLQRARER
ncbi:SDR family oxidoreductase [Cupriavidus agavae]|uniref:Short-subunit dehydrogenase n=1 Tax=Cupriavidus agavae TaxID=1001822 RepID=A0A4Q7RR27_9BURK|nr:SDR family oxidoreductase [Cupriavidus agavae]RZT35437.1 short-subunit dehydrogenase [Cupriavidus agavae]